VFPVVADRLAAADSLPAVPPIPANSLLWRFNSLLGAEKFPAVVRGDFHKWFIHNSLYCKLAANRENFPAGRELARSP
jgi:hypothetical protein